MKVSGLEQVESGIGIVDSDFPQTWFIRSRRIEGDRA